MACAIQKELHFREDCLGEEGNLYYVKNKDGKEIDFCIFKEGIPSVLLEVKWNDSNLSHNFKIFKKVFPRSYNGPTFEDTGKRKDVSKRSRNQACIKMVVRITLALILNKNPTFQKALYL